MSDALYPKTMLRLAAAAHGAGRLSGACCSGREANSMCGDEVTFDVRLDEAGRIAEVANELKGCLYVQASASLLAEHAVGRRPDEIMGLRGQVAGMLEGGAAPGDVWAAYEVFKPVTDYRSRHSCVLLPIDALVKALDGCAPS